MGYTGVRILSKVHTSSRWPSGFFLNWLPCQAATHGRVQSARRRCKKPRGPSENTCLRLNALAALWSFQPDRIPNQAALVVLRRGDQVERLEGLVERNSGQHPSAWRFKGKTRKTLFDDIFFKFHFTLVKLRWLWIDGFVHWQINTDWLIT